MPRTRKTGRDLEFQPPVATAGDPYQVLFEGHPRPMFVFDPESLQILAVNQAAIDDYGYSRDEFRSLTMADIRPEEELSWLRERLAHRQAGTRHVGGVWRHRRKNGSEMLVEVASSDVPFMGRLVRLAVITDVTEREQALAAARQSETRKASILEVVQDAVVAADFEGRITEFNPAAERIFGYARDEVLGRDVADVLIPAYRRSAHRRGMANYLETGERSMIGRSSEVTALRADGSEFRIEVTVAAIQVDGQPAFTAVVRDLTERDRAEDYLQVQYGMARLLGEASGLESVSRDILRLLCESSEWEVGHLWVLDPAAGVLRFRDSWQAGGLPIEPLEAENRKRAYPPGLGLPGTVLARRSAICLRDLAAEHAHPRMEIARRCGLRSVCAFPVVSGTEVLGVVELLGRGPCAPGDDLLEMFQAAGSRLGLFLQREHEKEKLIASTRNLQGLLSASPLGIVVLSTDSIVQYWNPTAERLFGYSEREMLGISYALVVPEDRRQEFMRIIRTCAGGEKVLGVHTWRKRKDGRPVEVLVSAAPLIDSRGNVTSIIGMFNDLSGQDSA